jgi:hypothetical protein
VTVGRGVGAHRAPTPSDPEPCKCRDCLLQRARLSVDHSKPVRKDSRPKKLVKRTIWYTQRAETYRGGRFTVESAPYQVQDEILVEQAVKDRKVKPIVLKSRVDLD